MIKESSTLYDSVLQQKVNHRATYPLNIIQLNQDKKYISGTHIINLLYSNDLSLLTHVFLLQEPQLPALPN